MTGLPCEGRLQEIGEASPCPITVCSYVKTTSCTTGKVFPAFRTATGGCPMFAGAIELWVIIQVVVDLLLIIVLVAFVKQARGAGQGRVSSVSDAVARMLEPLLKDAGEAAKQFEAQLMEKKRLVRELNEQLDTRIISLNLLLRRAEFHLAAEGKGAGKGNRPGRHVYDIQQEIISLGEKGLGEQDIAERLGISEGEVTLVLELKRKFDSLGKNN